MSAVTRRVFLEVLALTGVAVSLPGCGSAMLSPTTNLTFFTDEERVLLGKLCDHVFPPDDTPGAVSLGAVPYIESLLSAFEVTPPRIYAGGPFSGRQPYPDASHGVASGTRPANAFANFLPLSRVADAAWRLRLYGSSGVTGGGPNDALLGPVVGWRELFKQGLMDARQAVPGTVDQLDDAGVARLWTGLGAPFKAAVTTLTIEGVFSAPEYGGNKDGGGWKLAHFEGDSQPLGYSQFDQTAGIYRERPDAPLSTANPGPDPAPMTAATASIVEGVTKALGGRVA